MGRRVQEGGGSEGRTVVVRIGVARSPSGKPGRLPPGRSVREPWANQLQEAEQMTAAGPLVRLRPTGTRRKAWWLPNSTAQVVDSHDWVSGGHGRLMSGLSCLRGNSHEQCAP